MTKETVPPITGTGLVRDATRIWAAHGSLGILARDTGSSLHALEAFLYQRAKLGPEVMQALTRIVLPHAEYDPGRDLLRNRLSQPSVPLGNTPQPYAPRPDAYPPPPSFIPGAPALYPAPKAKPVPKVPKPGWV
jgi:hypothetical protein